MSHAAVLALRDAQRGLIAALDADAGAGAVEQATARVALALRGVEAVGAWAPTPELHALLHETRSLGEAARIRVRYLAEHGRARLAHLQALTGRGMIGYGRDGRHRAA